MSDEHTNDEQSIFTEALARHSAQERSAYLDRTCGDDPQLRARVEVLLAAHDRAGAFLQSPPAGLDPAETVDRAGDHTPAPSEGAGSTVGRYKLLEQIGEGGMGVVFMAEQTHPVRRRVALKIIKPGMDSRQVVARFEAERQALALMDHPNIAKVLDAGATNAGRPYFVMELVRGAPITEYCDQHKLPPRQRLELFIEVCRAVQHAHTKGIIHRDLKPNNVLVTVHEGEPVPKVIDFGVAKATAGQRLTDHTLFTEFRQVIGTPLYMSPEQAEMSAVMDVDTRSDVYSLGVMLYELLTGTTPFDRQRLAKAAFDEVRRIIREEEPPRPSTRLSTLGETLARVSAQRDTDPKKLGGIVRGELDWIVMRSLEKDRTRRYETANGLARDVERYLSDEAVEACPPSRSYRLRTFGRRHRTGLTTAAGFAAVLVLATGVSVWQAVRATRAKAAALAAEAGAVVEKNRADEGRDRYAAISNFMSRSVLGRANPQSGIRDLTLGEALDGASQTIGEDLKDHPQLQAAIRLDLAQIYNGRGEHRKAVENAETAVRLFHQVKGPEFRGTIIGKARLAAAYDGLGESAKAGPLWDEVLAGYYAMRSRSEDTTDLDGDVAGLMMDRGHVQEAEGLLLRFIGPHLKADGDVPEELLHHVASLAGLRFGQRRLDEAKSLLARVLSQARRSRGEGNAITVYAKRYLAAIHAEQGRYDDARPLYLDVLAASQKQYGPRHERTLEIQNFLGVMYTDAGELDEAQSLLQDTWQAARETLGERHKLTLQARHTLAVAYVRAGRNEDAAPIYQEVLTAQREVFGERHAMTAQTFGNLGSLYKRLGRYADLEKLYRDAVKLSQASQGPENTEVAALLMSVGEACEQQGATGEAEAAYRDALRMRKKLNFPIPAGQSLMSLGKLLKANPARLGEAEQAFRDAERLLRDAGDDQALATALYELGDVAVRRKQLGEAEKRYREVMDIRRKAPVKQPPGVGADRVELAAVVRKQGRTDEANQLEREGIEELRKSVNGVALADALHNVGHVMQREGQAGAVDLFREALAIRKRVGTEVQVCQALVDFGEAIHGQPDGLPEAEAAYREAVAMCRKPSISGAVSLPAVLELLAGVLRGRGERAEAQSLHREALELFPKEMDNGDTSWRITIHFRMAHAMMDAGEIEQAKAACRKALDAGPTAADAGSLNDAAWRLATAADPAHRDPGLALELAEKACKLRPKDGAAWNTLGVARYRAGDCRPAATELETSVRIRQGGDSYDFFFLAMAHHDLGDTKAARDCYDKGVAWMDEHASQKEELLRFRAEAEQVLDGRPTFPASTRPSALTVAP